VIERHAVVAHAGRQVQQVAGMRQILFVFNAPAAHAGALQQEDVVAVDVRADTAARRGVAHHHVVQPRLRHEGEALQQLVGRRNVVIDAVHEQGGALRKENARERPVRRLPAPAAGYHDAGFDVITPREGDERVLIHNAGEMRQRRAHEKRTFLPITPQKSAWLQSAE
jgi:hypothetical protein